MKKARLALAFLPLLLAVGCTSPTPEPVSPASASAPAPSVSTNTYSDHWNDGKVNRCTYSISVPHLWHPWFGAPSDEPEQEPAFAAANREIQIAYGLASSTSKEIRTPADLAKSFIDACRSESTDRDDLLYESDTSFSLQYLTGRYASFTIEGYEYTGGAHGNPWMQGLTLDLKTGKKLLLGDILKNVINDDVAQRVSAKVIEQFGDALFDEAKEDLKKAKGDPNAENFYLSGEGIVFFWNVYDISPYAAGQPIVMIPWAELQDDLAIER